MELATVALSIRIDGKLSSTVSSPGCSIFRVPNPLRQTNEKAYEPHLFSIGPYHHGKDHLKGMEVHKMHCLKGLLQRTGETSVKRYVMALKGMEEEIRKCYAEPLDHVDGDALVEMMLLDGCFIIELIREYQNLKKPDSAESAESADSPDIELREKKVNFHYITLASVTRDLLLVENQLPFFVLLELFTLVPNQKNNFIHMALHFFSGMMPGPGIQHNSLVNSDQNIKNLTGFVHDSWFPSNSYSKNSAVHVKRHVTVPNATSLQKAGIEFISMDVDKEKSMFHIKFEKDLLRIPTIRIEENTDSILRNLIAHEQFHESYPRYVTDYVTFMDCLIKTKKDVNLLCRARIIANGLGDDEVVATIFNKLCHQIQLSDENIYSKIFMDLNCYCYKPWNEWRTRVWNVWMANLWNNYFSTPWAFISFIAAVFLLILTALQTIYSLLSYYQE